VDDPAVGDQALAEAEKLLKKRKLLAKVLNSSQDRARGSHHPPDSNMAIISIAGRYAADEAWECLRRGLHVLCSAHNVTLRTKLHSRSMPVNTACC
jgi:succinyl-CoA synthetase alpha subunit